MNIAKTFLFWLCAAGALASTACEAEIDAPPAPEPGATLGAALAEVGPGAKTELVAVVAAENQLFTSDGRLFVTGDDGIFELVDGGATAVERAPKQDCKFGGIAEANGVIYANCYALGGSYLYAAALSAEPEFSRVYAIEGAPLANGLAADPAGRLYVASTFRGQIVRLSPTPDDPLVIAGDEVWLDGAGLLANGLKYHEGSFYWSDGGTIKRAALGPDGRPGPIRVIVAALTVFDDVVVDDQGILVADFLGGVIRSYALTGCQTGATKAAFAGPSSVARALGRAGLPADGLVVTERVGGRVSLFEPDAR